MPLPSELLEGLLWETLVGRPRVLAWWLVGELVLTERSSQMPTVHR